MRISYLKRLYNFTSKYTIMNQNELIKFAETFFSKSVELLKTKNMDYANPEAHNNDAFANLKAVGTFGIPVEIGFITRMTDKLSRLATFAKVGHLQAKDESVVDTLRDLSNYSVLFAAWLESEKTKLTHQPKQFT